MVHYQMRYREARTIHVEDVPSSRAGLYGPDNPWNQWLAENAPKELEKKAHVAQHQVPYEKDNWNE